MSTDKEPAENPHADAESVVTTEAETETLDPMVTPKPAQGSAILLNTSKMVSGGAREEKSSIDYITSGVIDEIKRISETMLSLVRQNLQQQQEELQEQQQQSQVVQAAEDLLTELDKKVQQILKHCADVYVSTKEKENIKSFTEQLTQSEQYLKTQLKKKTAEIEQLRDDYEARLKKKESDLAKLQENLTWKSDAEESKKQMEISKQEANEYKQKLEKADKIKQRLDQENKNYQDMKEQDKKENEKLKRENEELKRENEELKREKGKLQSRNNNLQAKLKDEEARGWSYATQQEKKDESQQTEIKELKVINKELKDELSKKEKHIVDLERDLAVSKSYIESKQQLLDQREKDVEYYRTIQMHTITTSTRQLDTTSTRELEMTEQSVTVKSAIQKPQS